MLRTGASRRLRAVFWVVLWFGSLLCLDLGCRQAFGPDYFRKTGFLGLAIAISLGAVPYRYPTWRRERAERADAQRAFMRRHAERMVRVSSGSAARG